MLKNYLLIATRAIVRSKFYFITSVAGLSIALAAAMLMLLYVKHETNYDSFHTKGDRIVRINAQLTEPTGLRTSSRIPFPTKAILLQDYPEVEKIARLFHSGYMKSPIRYKDALYLEEVFYGDPEFFEIFDFELVKGDRNAALANPGSIIVTEATALKYFGSEDPMGKTMRFENNTDLTVTGVLKNFPTNSHVRFDALLPTEFLRNRWKIAANNFYDFEEDWLWHGAWTYVLLKEGADQHAFGQKITALPEKHYPELERKKSQYVVQPLASVHLTSGVSDPPMPTGSTVQVYGFLTIAVLILVIACINFTNLATAQAPKRSKEVGLRKVMGAVRHNLILQFLGESMLIVFFSALVGFVLAQVCLPFFNTLTGKELQLSMMYKPGTLAFISLCMLLVGAMAGLYPSLRLSRFNPAKTLKGVVSQERNSVFSFRSSLVVFQLSVSILLISGILVIQDQMNYIRNKDLGLDKEQILTLKNGMSFGNFTALKNGLLQVAGVEEVYRGYFPGAQGWSVPISVEGIAEPVSLSIRFVKENFISMFNLTLVAGRDFIAGHSTDTLGAALVNEKAVQQLGLNPDDILGRELSYVGGNDNKTLINFRVVGVIKDANFESLYKPVQPAVFQLTEWGDIAIKIAGGNIPDKVKKIESVYRKIAPEWPFEYSFLDQDMDAQYQSEEKLATTIQYFAVLAVLICSAGLLALSAFTAQQRMKEIAIRKVHGAPTQGLVYLLTGYFVKLGLIGLLVAVPVSIYLSTTWLQTFAYRAPLGPLLLIKTILFTLALICVTVMYQVLRVSRENPVNSLKADQ